MALTLLTKRTRMAITNAVKAGVPVRAAASALGVRPVALAQWLALGSSMDKVEKPANVKTRVRLPEGDSVDAVEWYEHCRECVALSNEVMTHEGALVATLAKRMWKATAKDNGMRMFLWKNYSHVHGLNEKPSTPAQHTERVGETAGEAEDKVVIYVPDNGRGPKS